MMVEVRIVSGNDPMDTGSGYTEESFFQQLRRTLKGERMRRPSFSSCWVVSDRPEGSHVVEEYSTKSSEVKILSLADGIRTLYHITPHDYGYPTEWVKLIAMTMERLSHLPPNRILGDHHELGQHVFVEGRKILVQIAEREEISLGDSREDVEENIGQLLRTIKRYTVGLGIFDLLLEDDRIEDIYVDSPPSKNRVHLTLSNVAGFNSVLQCTSNIIASEQEVDAFVCRLRHYTGNPFSEAFPVLETDVHGYDTRATVIGPPLSPKGNAIALRRHSRTPWTLPKMMHNGTMDAFSAGLISFLMDGNSTILICGARGAGKSSLLSALLFEFPITQRILTIEDTIELPVANLQQMGYNIQSLLVEKRIDEDLEKKTDDALRVSLRLGESAIVLGEVRGKEARTLYQSMRTGKAGSAVLGTIHGQSAESVYKRVVHDMGISGEAFAATDIVLTMGLRRPRGSQRQIRKLVEISECAKDEGVGEFNRLFQYQPNRSGYRDFENSRFETISRIADSWHISYEDALSNIWARAEIRETLIDLARKKGEEFLDPVWVCRANDFFWNEIESGRRDYQQLAIDFEEWVSGRNPVEGQF